MQRHVINQHHYIYVNVTREKRYIKQRHEVIKGEVRRSEGGFRCGDAGEIREKEWERGKRIRVGKGNRWR
jgi:hypothetical protein